ncbi:cupin domain-containing protein [Martelella sp. HB161492]|uniref:cupin domain-containing protein n=1 Tax=Martelella sp. HB161492 TaxID=2720726 RepID=UPI0015924285|nr:cupin domain-containing protein [Martelella sp. HB161492]
MRPVVNIDEVPLIEASAGTLFAERYAPLGSVIGARKLGYNLTIVPPGKRCCPFHNHHTREEMFFILSGEGSYRYGGEHFPVRAGDILAAPAGGRETAHHLINTGTQDLKYLCVSTMQEPDLCEYPDSDKFLVSTRQDGSDEPFRFIGRKAASLDYFDGEI